MSDPQPTFEDDFHRHEFYEGDDHVATIEFDDIGDERGGIWCETTVYYHMGGRAEPIISFERANLQNKTTGALKSIKMRLEEVAPGVNWSDALVAAAGTTITEYRTSSSEGGFLDVLDPDAADAKDPYLLRPFVAATGTSIIYGKHGSAKSMIAVRISATVITGKPLFGEVPQHTGPVLYVDFEDSPEPHQYRMFAIAMGMDIKPEKLNGMLYHERVSRNMKDARRRLRRVIREEGIVLVVVDSIGLARASDVSGSEATIKLFKMFGTLDTPVLALDHMSKENNTRAASGKLKQEDMSPIGSQFTESSSRLGWGVVMMPQSTAQRKVLNLYNTKHNHMPEQDPMSINIDMAWNEKSLLTKVIFTKRDEFAHAVIADGLRLSNVQELLVYHFTQQRDDGKVIPMSFKHLSDGSGQPYGSVSSYVGTRNKEWWEKVPGSKLYILSPLGMEMAMLYASISGLKVAEKMEDENG